MSFDPTLAEIRFGCGLSPRSAPPGSVRDVLRGLTEPDAMAQRFPIEEFDTFLLRIQDRMQHARIYRQNRETEIGEAARMAMRDINVQARRDSASWMAAMLARRIETGTGLRERLVAFWADHFTATGKSNVIRRGTSPYIESAIRPRIAGSFEDLLIAAVTHPLMVHYLDQTGSVGPNSARSVETGTGGLNENLAREVLELHTLGVGGPYTQDDVTELAKLLTGLGLSPKSGRTFRKAFAEPGPETVLGRSYGGAKPGFRDIEMVLRDLARHPATARHIATKLAVHFVADQPDPALVAALDAAYQRSGGNLLTVYEALLTHPVAWSPVLRNVKPPFDFVASALRALGAPAVRLAALKERPLRLTILHPLALMGQVWQEPDGPDGLPEEDSAWITPQGVAARLQWAIAMPERLVPALPDPRDFVETALGSFASPAVRFAAEAAESRADGIGLVLASPAFQRM
ncbi:DUF1800 domain-containing protein [Thalassococcus sp. CAU 1522]|uniref:DUF1800 domain-containing protein n=1 Tax=Thalassococcus arenae TaxID=2851652 RepID=A0ABS6N6M9_9RHOB|nr:DUF1800 domain-containing protein [Thalassococcus arenae]MBV2359666.1 DUF1800 domain-containing protein [Thalassococcus arenae]